MGVKLFLIRHGQTEWNAEGRYQGYKDTELTEYGKKQAALAAKYLSKVVFTNIYSSPQKRALETAKIFSVNIDLKIIARENLRELNFGLWEGLKFEELNKIYHNDYQEWLKDPFNNTPTNGESFKSLTVRASNEIDRILSENPDGSNIAIITHGGIIVSLIVKWLQIPASCWGSVIQRQGAINVVVLDKGFPYLSLMNFTGHLNKFYDENEDKIIETYSKLKKENKK
jgi:alpha-ribazole phosphatase